MPRPQDFITKLTTAEVERLENWVREKYRTVDNIHTFIMAEFGFVDSDGNPDHPRSLSRGAAGRWAKRFRTNDRLVSAQEKARWASEFAKAGLNMSDAAIGMLSQQAFDLSLEKPDVEKTAVLALAMQRLTLAQNRTEDVKAKMEARQRLAVEEATRVKDSGGTAANVVDKVREILGMNQ